MSKRMFVALLFTQSIMAGSCGFVAYKISQIKISHGYVQVHVGNGVIAELDGQPISVRVENEPLGIEIHH